MIILQVTKSIYSFFTQRNLAHTNTFSVSTSIRWTGNLLRYFFSISISSNVKISLSIFICDNKFLCFIIFCFFQQNWHFALRLWPYFCHSHNKLKDNMEDNLDWVLFVAELEFAKILVPRLPQNTSNVNIVCVRKSKQKQLYSLCDQLLGALICLNFIILSLICFWLIRSGVNYVIYGCSFARTTPGESLYRIITLEENHCWSYYLR